VANKPNRSTVNHKLLPINHPVVKIMDLMSNSQRVTIIALVSVIGMTCPCEIMLSRLLFRWDVRSLDRYGERRVGSCAESIISKDAYFSAQNAYDP
jgi:hypothetical protein